MKAKHKKNIISMFVFVFAFLIVGGMASAITYNFTGGVLPGSSFTSTNGNDGFWMQYINVTSKQFFNMTYVSACTAEGCPSYSFNGIEAQNPRIQNATFAANIYAGNYTTFHTGDVSTIRKDYQPALRYIANGRANYTINFQALSWSSFGDGTEVIVKRNSFNGTTLLDFNFTAGSQTVLLNTSLILDDGESIIVIVQNKSLNSDFDAVGVKLFITAFPVGVPIILFVNPTPANNSVQYYTNDSFILNTSTLDISGILNHTHTLYYENGSIAQSVSSSSANFTNTFTGLGAGRYYFDANVTNGTYINITERRTITIYNITPPVITIPVNNSNISRFLNVTWTNASTTNNSVNINNFRIYLLNASSIFVNTINTTALLTNTLYDLYNASLTVGQYYIVIEANDTNGNKVNSTPILFNHPTDSLFNITAFNNSNGAQILIFSVNVTDLNTSQLTQYSTTNGFINAHTIRGHTYNIFLDAPSFAFNSTNITQNQVFTNVQFGAVASNSINITIRDEETGLLLNGTTSITLTNNNTQYSYNTTTGNIFVTGLMAGQYTASFSNGNYSVRTYVVTITDRSTQNLNVFLADPYSTTLFTITDIGTGAIIPDTMCTMYSFVNGSLVVVESKIADVTGRIQWSFRTNTFYQFLCIRSGYTDRVFSLNNILFTTYNVQMQRSSTTATVGDIVVFFSPTQLFNNQSNRFTWIIQSPNGLLTSYGFNITSACYTNTTNTGNNANGGAFQFNITLNSSCTPIQRVLLTSFFTDSNGTTTVQYANLGIIGTVNAYTFLSNQDNDFGFGDFEKILIVTFIVLVVGGVAGLLGGPVIGTVVGLFIMWYFVMTGFIPASMIYVSLAIGIVLLVARLANEW